MKKWNRGAMRGQAAAVVCGCLGMGVFVLGGRMSMAAELGAASAPAVGAAETGAVPADVEKALAMSAGKERNQALVAAAVAWGKVDLTAALSWAVKTKAAGPAVVPVAMVDPAKSEMWLAEHYQTGNFHGTLLRWTVADPAAATAWCEKDCPKAWRYVAFFSAGDGWIRKGDRKGAEAWAEKVADPEDHKAAIHGVALMLGRIDVAAAGEWIKTLKHDDMKFAATVVVSEWYLTKLKTSKEITKEEAVKAWLAGIPLSDAEKAEVMAAKGPDSLGMAPKAPKAAKVPKATKGK